MAERLQRPHRLKATRRGHQAKLFEPVRSGKTETSRRALHADWNRGGVSKG